jgi:hypothetical protein
MANALPTPQFQRSQEKRGAEGSAPRAVEPACESVVYGGDRIALQVWLVCFFLLWTMNLFNLVTGLWGRWPG